MQKNLLDLHLMTSDEVYHYLDGISEEQACNSDFGGDSDAEDQIQYGSSTSSEVTSAKASPKRLH